MVKLPEFFLVDGSLLIQVHLFQEVGDHVLDGLGGPSGLVKGLHHVGDVLAVEAAVVVSVKGVEVGIEVNALLPGLFLAW